MDRPGRPFGVSLAIVASVFLFTILPLLQIGGILMVRQHFLNIRFGDEGPTPIAMGGDFLGVPESSLFWQATLSLSFLIIAVFAWRGRPKISRYIMIIAVFGLTLLKLVTVVTQALSQPEIQAGVSALNSVTQSLAIGQLVIEIMVMLYVMWYMNRGPARAFYQGYYLAEPADTAANKT